MDSKFKIEEHLRIISNSKDFQANGVVNDVLRASSIFLPNTLEIERQYAKGKLFESLRDKASIKYKEELNKIMEGVFYE